jgi:hypothetical protein
MEIIKEDFDLSGCTMLFSNDTHEYIVYEQILRDEKFVPIEESLYKFHFRVIDDEVTLMSNARITYEAFRKEYIALAMYFTKIEICEEDRIDSITLRKFVKKNMLKYQFQYC